MQIISRVECPGKTAGKLSMPSDRKLGPDKIAERKKETECQFLYRALKDLGLCSFKVSDHETPDFLVDFGDGGGRVGVEVTGYHMKKRPSDPFPRRQIEEYWEEMRKALMSYSRDHPDLKHISGIIGFKDLTLPKKDEWNAFFEELREYIKKVASKLGTEAEEFPIPRFRFNGELIKRYLRSLRLERVGASRWNWNHNVDSVGTTASVIADIIKEKSKKAYKDKSDNPSATGLRPWLVVHGGYDVSKYLMILGGIDHLNGNQDLAAILDRSPFERVLLLADGDTQVWDRGAAWRNVDHGRF
jgi:hypothetical protein